MGTLFRSSPICYCCYYYFTNKGTLNEFKTEGRRVWTKTNEKVQKSINERHVVCLRNPQE